MLLAEPVARPEERAKAGWVAPGPDHFGEAGGGHLAFGCAVVNRGYGSRGSPIGNGGGLSQKLLFLFALFQA